MKKKKIVALLTACMLMTGMFTGCGSSQQAAVSVTGTFDRTEWSMRGILESLCYVPDRYDIYFEQLQ